MKKVLVCLTVALLAGCSSNSKRTDAPSTSPQNPNPQSASPRSARPRVSRLTAAAKRESDRLASPSQPLSAFSDFELKPMALNPDIAAHPEKVEVAKQLEGKLRTKLMPLIEEWKADKNSPRTAGTLLIQPKLQSFRIISGGARFAAGAWAGNSTIDLNLELIDGKTGTVIASPRINRDAGGSAGAGTIGATDRHLLDWAAEVSYQYLADNYKK